jgi:hypothetical protein
MKQLSALEQLLGGHLHEDWADDYADEWQAIDRFVRSQPSYALAVRGEIEQLLRQCNSEASLEQRLEELGLVFYPPGMGWTSYRAWLLAVADRVEETLRTSPAA